MELSLLKIDDDVDKHQMKAAQKVNGNFDVSLNRFDISLTTLSGEYHNVLKIAVKSTIHVLCGKRFLIFLKRKVLC